MANVVNSSYGARWFGVLPSAARTATPDTQEFDLPAGYSGLALVVDVTAVTATPSVTVKIEGVDRTSGKTWEILTGTAVTATGTSVLRVHPALTASAGATAKDVLPPVVRITATHLDADSITYSVAAHLTD